MQFLAVIRAALPRRGRRHRGQAGSRQRGRPGGPGPGAAGAGRAAAGAPAGSRHRLPQRQKPASAAGRAEARVRPRRHSLTQRRHAKAAELAALDPEQARLLGLDHVGYRTLIRWENGRRRAGLVGCADDRWLRESGGHPSVTGQIREAMLMVREQTRHRSRVTDENQARPWPASTCARRSAPRRPGSPPTGRSAGSGGSGCGPGGARPRNDGSDGPAGEGHGHVVVHQFGAGRRAGHHGAAGKGPRGHVRRPGERST